MASETLTAPLLQPGRPPVASGRASECDLHRSCFLNDGIGQRSMESEQKKVQTKLKCALVLATCFLIVEVIGGYMAQSVAIMSDAAHMLSDVAGFGMSLLASYAVTWRSHHSYSFGYHRAEIIGALFSTLVIWAVTGALLWEAVERVINPQIVDGKIMFIVAVAGVLFNIILSLVLGDHHSHGLSGHDHDHDHDHDHGHGHGKKVSGAAKAKSSKSHACAHGASGHNHADVEKGHEAPPLPKSENPSSSSQLRVPAAHAPHQHDHDDHDHDHDDHEHGDGHSHEHDHAHGTLKSKGQLHAHGHGLAPDHGHDHNHDHGHDHGHGGQGGHSHGNLNMRSAVLHVIGDLLQSIGVAIAGALIWWHQGDPRWVIADPICTFVFAFLVLLTTKNIIKDIIHTLMERTPVQHDIVEMLAALLEIEGVQDVHDLHVWNLSMGIPILTAHIHAAPDMPCELVLKRVELFVRSRGIEHSTVQICNRLGSQEVSH